MGIKTTVWLSQVPVPEQSLVLLVEVENCNTAGILVGNPVGNIVEYPGLGKAAARRCLGMEVQPMAGNPKGCTAGQQHEKDASCLPKHELQFQQSHQVTSP